MRQIASALLLALPVVLSGICQILFLKKRWLRSLYIPIDANKHFRGQPIFGRNKTWLGFTIMGVVTSVSGSLLWLTSDLFRSLVNIPTLTLALFSFFMIGISYSLGELPNSFVKRRLRIPPGNLPSNSARKVFEVVDLIDGIILVGLVYIVFLSMHVFTVLLAILIGIFIHFLSDKIMLKLDLKTK
jgi:hypothetical protein